jgi:hypothetical protein
MLTRRIPRRGGAASEIRETHEATHRPGVPITAIGKRLMELASRNGAAVAARTLSVTASQAVANDNIGASRLASQGIGPREARR